MMLTLFCDASHCSQSRAAGWGAWGKRDGWDRGLIFGGAINGSPANSTEAELAGIAQAMVVLDDAGHLVGVDRLMIQCDNISALAAIRTLDKTAWSRSEDRRDSSSIERRAVFSPFEKRAIANIVSIIGERSVFLRHVKGHSKGTGRNWVNQQCDSKARRFMRAERARMQGGEVSQ